MAVAIRNRVSLLYEATADVVGQEKARAQLAVLLDRQADVATGRLPRSSGALLVGHTGVGKTYTVRKLAAALDLPVAEANATQYTDKGYVGLDLSQVFLPLLTAAAKQYDEERERAPWRLEVTRREPSILKRPQDELQAIVRRAETGIIMLDEFDKWMLDSADTTGRNVGKKLQAELLKMVEGSKEYVSDDEEEIGVVFDTSRVLFICVGAFTNLTKIASKRLSVDSDTGFQDHDWDKIQPVDFEKYGLLPELAGRLSTHVFLRPLRKEHLAQIMLLPGSAFNEYRQRFEELGLKWVVGEDAVGYIADVALSRGTGARGVDHVLWGMFSEALFKASHEGGSRVVLRVNSPKAEVL